jgi:nitrate reductase gamma subunit
MPGNWRDESVPLTVGRRMLKNVKDHKDLRSLLLALLSTSGTLAGISLALVGIVNLKVSNTRVETLADDMFLLSSLGFLVVCYLTFFTLRRHNWKSVQHWTNLIDVVFLSSLTLLVTSGFVVVYEFM